MNERAPAKLGKRGRSLWKTVTATYQLRPEELELLEDMCRTRDLIDRLQAEIDGSEVMVAGSMGQFVTHPLVQEIRQQRNTYRQLTTRLDLPDSEGNSPAAGKRKAKASTAARARWGATATTG